MIRQNPGIPETLALPEGVPEFILYMYPDEEFAENPVDLVDASQRQREFGGMVYEAVSIQHSESFSAWLYNQVSSVTGLVESAGMSKVLWGHDIFSSRQKTTDVIYHLSYRNFPGVNSTDAAIYDAIFQQNFAEDKFLTTVGQVQQQYKSFHAEMLSNVAVIAVVGAMVVVASAVLEAGGGARGAWSTARRGYYENLGEEEAKAPSGRFSKRNIERMIEGDAPRIKVQMRNRKTGQLKVDDIPLELHHRDLPQRMQSTKQNESWNLELVTRWAHEGMDEYRHAGWDLVKIINGPNSW